MWLLQGCCLRPSPIVWPNSLPLLQLDQALFFCPCFLSQPQFCPRCPYHPFGVVNINAKPPKLPGSTCYGQCPLLLENTLAMASHQHRVCNRNRNRFFSLVPASLQTDAEPCSPWCDPSCPIYQTSYDLWPPQLLSSLSLPTVPCSLLHQAVISWWWLCSHQPWPGHQATGWCGLGMLWSQEPIVCTPHCLAPPE